MNLEKEIYHIYSIMIDQTLLGREQARKAGLEEDWLGLYQRNPSYLDEVVLIHDTTIPLPTRFKEDPIKKYISVELTLLEQKLLTKLVSQQHNVQILDSKFDTFLPYELFNWDRIIEIESESDSTKKQLFSLFQKPHKSQKSDPINNFWINNPKSYRFIKLSTIEFSDDLQFAIGYIEKFHRHSGFGCLHFFNHNDAWIWQNQIDLWES